MSEVSREVAEILRAQREAGHAVDPALAERLRACVADPSTLVGMLLSGIIPITEPEQSPQALNRYQEALALEALREAPAERVRACLPEPSESVRDGRVTGRVLRVLGAIASAAETGELLDRFDAAERPRAARQDLVAALVDVLGRDPGAFVKLPLDGRAQVTRAMAVNALGESGSPRALPVLLSELKAAAVPADLVLTQMARCGPTFDVGFAKLCAESVTWYLEDPEPRVREAACRVLGMLDVPVGVAERIELLDGEDGSVARAAHASLCSLSGLRLPAQANLWSSWYARVGDVGQLRLDRTLDDALHARDTDLTRILRDLAQHQLHKHEIALGLVPLLGRREDGVRSLACTLLGELRSPQALPALVLALDDESEEVAAAAARALAEITGLHMQAEDAFRPASDLWSDWIEEQALEL